MHVDLHQKVRDCIDKSLLGQTSTDEQRMLTEHLGTCDECRQYLEASNRVVTGLGGFSFEVDPELQEKVMAALTLRAEQLGSSTARKPMGWIYLAALLLTITGSLVVARLSGFVAGYGRLEPGSLQSGVLALWIVPSLCFCILFPLLHRLIAGEKGISQ